MTARSTADICLSIMCSDLAPHLIGLPYSRRGYGCAALGETLAPDITLFYGVRQALEPGTEAVERTFSYSIADRGRGEEKIELFLA